MKQWRVRLAFMVSDEEYWITDETVKADEMGTALSRAVRQGWRAVVPKGKRIRQLRARVERADAEDR